MDLLQLWVRGENHLLVRGPRMSYADTLAAFQQMEVPSIASLLGNEKRPSHIVVTRAFRENIEAFCILPSPAAHSEAIEILLEELRARSVTEIRATDPL